MKFILLFLLPFFSHAQNRDEIIFNHDILHCAGVYQHPLKVEASYGLYRFNDLDSSLSLAFSPAREKLIRFIQQDLENVLFLSGVSIQRSSPVSLLITPKNCTVEVLAEVRVSPRSYRVILNTDVYRSLSPLDLEYVWLNLALDIEQALGIISRARPFNQIQAREFMACLYSSTCPSFLYLDPVFGLSFIEQDGLIISTENNKLEFYPERLIKSFERLYDKNHPSFRHILTSYFNFQDQRIPLSPVYRYQVGSLVFDQRGKAKCSAVPLETPLIISTEKWSMANWGNNNFVLAPLCLNERGGILQGFLHDDFQHPFFHSMNGHQIKISPIISSSGDKIQGSFFIFYPDGKIHWMLNGQGVVSIGHQKKRFSGFVSFYPSGALKCAQFIESLGGSRPLVCFDELGNKQREYGLYEWPRYIGASFVSKIFY